MKKNPMITDATRQGFVDAFVQVHRKKPLSKIKVQEIVDITGNNRSTFYRYFSDVYALYDYLQEMVFQGIYPQVLASSHKSPTDEEFVEGFVAVFEEWKDYIEVILSETTIYGVPDRIRELYSEFMHKHLRIDLSDVRAAYVMDCYLAVITTVFRRWAQDKDALTAHELASMMKDLLNCGILPQMHEISASAR